jgi:hypothetical protein
MGGVLTLNTLPDDSASNVNSKDQIALLMCDSALQLLKFRFPECRALDAVVEPKALKVDIVLDAGERQLLSLPLRGDDQALAMLSALARLEEHLRLVVGRRPPAVLPKEQAVPGAGISNVVQFVRRRPNTTATATDVEDLCVVLSGKFDQLQELFAELRGDDDIDPEVLSIIADRIKTLATGAVDIAHRSARTNVAASSEIDLEKPNLG